MVLLRFLKISCAGLFVCASSPCLSQSCSGVESGLSVQKQKGLDLSTKNIEVNKEKKSSVNNQKIYKDKLPKADKRANDALIPEGADVSIHRPKRTAGPNIDDDPHLMRNSPDPTGSLQKQYMIQHDFKKSLDSKEKTRP